METFKNSKIMFGLAMLITLLFLLPGFAFGTDNDTLREYKFKNSEGVKATDLHIIWKTGAKPVELNPVEKEPADALKVWLGSGTRQSNGAAGANGTGVVAGDSVVLTFKKEAGGKEPRVEKWWWTNDNDPENTSRHDAAVIGEVKEPDEAFYSFASLPATGDGALTLTLFDGTFHTFEMPAGVNGPDMAQLFAQFITDEVPWAEVSHVAGGDVIMFNTSFSGETDFTVEIIPDSTMEVSFKYLPETIPTLSEWGVIILLLLVVAVGMVFLYQRQTSMALAGATAAFSMGAKPRLFDKKLFTKVFAITLLIGFAGLLGAYLWFGRITSADPFGVFVSAAVVAYMVQLHMLRKAGGQ
ncbi:MAG: hypothetical protein RBR47_12410 [Bacteroidales bacterium]|nr:hypothetical protein [Bacteroidales bacterium]MDD2633534.1 hypothetical protein [Bacteroidales bacterium]MDD4177767.1 hypothetical protein [Bacteroidales bacterium]MDD4742110.1 hypothetical protein [Bacteroidales bacterium]MDY0335750.1 hypothetical protein [Bacteroidales bacterium]